MFLQKRSHCFVIRSRIRHKLLLGDRGLRKSDLRSTSKAQGRRQQERRFHGDVAGIRFRGEGSGDSFHQSGRVNRGEVLATVTHFFYLSVS